MLSLAGRNALVTGGSRGIGRAVCALFGRLGARVAVGYQRDEAAAAEAVREAGGDAFAVRADLAVNLTSAWAVCQEAARHMVPRRSGAIVLVASTAGQRGEAEYAHYAASKGGLLALTKSLAAELAPHGIRVNGVAPGWVVTDMTRDALHGEGAAAALAKIPLARAGTPEEIAGPVAFLASELASYMYGEILAVNGGAVMTG
jgi:3-oxoacyl-[acyl-carrier protein] reductase